MMDSYNLQANEFTLIAEFVLNKVEEEKRQNDKLEEQKSDEIAQEREKIDESNVKLNENP